jgi:hypothetical protein
MKLSSVSALVLLLALINITCGQREQGNPIRVQADTGKVNGRLNLGGDYIELNHAYAIKTGGGVAVLLTDEAVPKTTLQALKEWFSIKSLKDFGGIFFILNRSDEEGLFIMQYGSGSTTLGTNELAVLDWKSENGRVIGEARFPKDGDKSQESFAVSFDAPIED